MLAFLNNQLLPAMRAIGYSIPDNAKIAVEKTTDPNKQISIDGVLLGRGYILTQDYIERTYGVEIESMPTSTFVGSSEGESKKA